MGLVHTEITLINSIDAANAKTGIVKEQDIRRITVKALVDTGAWTLVINEEIREKLGLDIEGTDLGTLTDGTRVMYNLAGPLEVRWKDRRAVCDALVLPGAEEVLLGVIPLEAMDLTVNLLEDEVIGVHGDQAIHKIAKSPGL